MIRRVMIVDDEPIVLEGLQEVLEKSGIPDLWLIPSTSATMAFQLMEETRVDVLITDIEMPHINGFALHSRLSARWPQVRTIFLTAHSGLDYLRTAVRQDRVDYILKSETDEVLLGALQRSLNLREGYTEVATELERIKTLLLTYSRPIVQEFLRNLIFRGQRQEIGHDGVVPGLRVSVGEKVIPLVVRFAVRDSRLEFQADYEVLLASAEKYLVTRVTFEALVLKDGEIALLVQSLSEGSQETFRFIRENLDLIQTTCLAVRDLRFGAAVLDAPIALPDLAPALKSLSLALREEMIHDPSALITLGESSASGFAPQDVSKGVPSAVSMAEEYMREHLDHQLSITSVADAVNLNPSYLSRLYHHYRGITLISFLTALRLERAKQLLSETDQKLSVIAPMIGLSTSSYLIAFFKTHLGMTPQVYRETQGRTRDNKQI